MSQKKKDSNSKELSQKEISSTLRSLGEPLRSDLEKARISAQEYNQDFFNHNEFWYKWLRLHAKLTGKKTFDNKPITGTTETLVNELIDIATEATPTIAEQATDKM